MIRFTTPLQEFIFEEDPQLNFTRIVISYSQKDKIILEKEKSDLEFSEPTGYNQSTYVASFRLTQEETAKFDPDDIVSIQVRVLTVDGNSLPSEIFECSVDDVLKKEVLYEN